MTKKKFSTVWIIVILMALTTACSKTLTPPEIEESGNMTENSFDPSGLEEEGFTEDDSKFAEEAEYQREQNFGDESNFQNESNVLTEEDLGALDLSAGNNDLELKEYDGGTPGNGSSGSFGMDGGSTGTSSGTMSQPDTSDFAQGVPDQAQQDKLQKSDEEARLFSYRATAELKDVHFEFDRYDLDERSKNVLSENATFLKDHPSVRVEIQGHCDERGTNNYNLALGQRRANSTKRFLKSLGVPETRMHVISYGEEKPFCAESNENCWWRNRRAHFLVAR